MINEILLVVSRQLSEINAKITIGLCVLVLWCSASAFANNLNVANVAVSTQDTSADTLTLQFDISWDNSWYDSTNYDAAWVFIKYSTDGGSTWNHATLKTAGINPSGFSIGSGTGIDILVAVDQKGAFIQRNAEGSGTLSTTSINFVWDYAADGISDANANNNSTRFKIFGLEMVYIPQGGFYAGDTTNGTNGEFLWETSIPGVINSETDIMSFESSAGTANAWYYTTDSGSDDVGSGTIFMVSSSFPKGYAAFYVMKYEITEGQWVAFFNTLTTVQKTTRDITSSTGKNSDAATNRNTLAWTSGDATTTRTDRACSYLSWMDLAAFADWAALRPMTELEFEKVCRGPLYPVAGEYAWGSTSITAAAQFSGSETGTETISTANANANYNSTTFINGDTLTGPVRSGIYATSSTTTRATTGASYYGVMELSGNVWERAVTVGNTAGRSFGGTHGDGVLIPSLSGYEGNATNIDWPGIDSTSIARGVTGAAGSGLKGGGWTVATANVTRLSVSNRWKAGTTDSTRGSDYGGRCVRTASA